MSHTCMSLPQPRAKSIDEVHSLCAACRMPHATADLSDQQNRGQPVTIDLTQDDSPPSSPPAVLSSQNVSGFSALLLSSPAAPSGRHAGTSQYPQLPQQPCEPYAELPPPRTPRRLPPHAREQTRLHKRKLPPAHQSRPPGVIPKTEIVQDAVSCGPLVPAPSHERSKKHQPAASSRIVGQHVWAESMDSVPWWPSADNIDSSATIPSSLPTASPGAAVEHPSFQQPTPYQGPAETANPLPDEPPLCPEQAALVELICSGRNVFYTGSAGCGKSTVLRAFTRRLQSMGKRVRILAPTGRAALQVNGSTTWTYAGWTPDHHKKPLNELKQAAHGKFVFQRLRMETDVIVIDEISMVENLHFERLNELMKEAWYDPKREFQPAFGGVQIIVTGDFCQLPPVKPFQHCIECGSELLEGFTRGSKTYTCPQGHGVWHDEEKWAFMSAAWEECNFEHVHLKQIHRQSDREFIRMLQKTRIGESLSPLEIKRLMDHPCRVNNATKLFATREQVREVNQMQFKKLTGVNHSYWCRDLFEWRRDLHPHLQWKGIRKVEGPPGNEELRPLRALDDHRFEQHVELKRGMLVVLLVNLELGAGLCNGSQGLICGFEPHDPKKMPKAVRVGRKEEAAPEGLKILGERAQMKELQIKAFIEGSGAPIKKWPVVRFHNGLTRIIYAECSITELGDKKPYSLLVRTQIPLAPAWAMTIHKSQSLTMDRVIVNLSRAFEEGQVYVALSRATGLEGLKIEGDAEALSRGLSGNKEVQQFLRERFGALHTLYGSSDSSQ